MKKQLSQKFTKSEKLKLIKAKYSLKDYKAVDFNDLSYRKKIYLLTVFRVLTDESFNKILPLTNEASTKVLSPSEDMDESILDCLCTKGVILVDPSSDVDAFQFTNGECVGFNIKEVSWVANISSKEKERLQLNTCYRLIYDDLTKFIPTSKQARDQVYSFTLSLALNEVENYLFFKIKELGYKFEFGKKTYVYIYQLLNFLSVSEIYSIIDKAIDEDYLFNSRSKSDFPFYGNTISEKLIELGELKKRNELSLMKAPRKEQLPRSEMSKVFYELIHEGKDEGFNVCPEQYWINHISKVYKQR